MKGGRRRYRRRRRGRGKVLDYLKRTKVLSSVLPAFVSAIPGVGPMAGALSGSILNQSGLGRRRGGRIMYGGRRRRYRRRYGRGPYSVNATPGALGNYTANYSWQTPRGLGSM